MAKSNRERLSEIITVLGKYGFGHIYRIYLKSNDQEEDARRFRMAFEELGPSFVKIGQILSTRHDLFPSSYIEELEKLQDDAPSIPFAEIQEIIEKELKQPLEEIFQEVEKEALASASIAQVHRAILKNGDEVIIKVQRPSIDKQLLQDIHLFSQILTMLPDSMKDIISNVDVAFEEIKRTTAKELNFRIEARSLLRFKNNHEDSKLVRAPTPYLNYTTGKVLVEEYVEGIAISQREVLINEGYVLEDIAEKLISSFLNQVFEDGFYHADLHPGNIIIKDQQIYFVDLGMMGEISNDTRELLVELTKAALTENISKLMDLILQVAGSGHKVDQVEFYDDLSFYFKQYSSRSLQNINMKKVLDAFMLVIRKHKLSLPYELISLARAIIILEGVALDLSPEMDILSILKAYYQNSDFFDFFKLPSKERIAIDSYSLLEKLVKLPADSSKFLDHLLNGRFVVNAQFLDRDNHWKDLELMVNRIIYALILAALILASAIVFSMSSGGFSIVAIIIFLGAVIVGIGLLISIFRSGMF